MTPFSEKVIQIIASIPAGKVLTYGAIATAAGNPRAARQVVRLLHSSTVKYDLPWHRVINSQGRIALKDATAVCEQEAMLAAEGIHPGPRGRINLKQYLWTEVLSPH